MKRIMLNLAPSVIVPDDAAEYDVVQRVTAALYKLEGIELVGVGRYTSAPVREGYCGKGQHPFYAPAHFPGDRPVPALCPDHAYTSAIEEAQAEHAPLFVEVERLTGMRGSIWQSGGMTMTMVWGDSEAGPAYLGLQEGVDEGSGAWGGSVGFYATRGELEGGEGEDVVMSGDLTPAQWAERIAAHFHALAPEVRAALRGTPESSGDDDGDVRGCSCGEADFGAPGHDGGPEHVPGVQG